MASLSFEGETHDEIIRKVRRWLASAEGKEGRLTTLGAIGKASEITKDALGVIASSAPVPVAQSELVKAMTRRGYDATDATREAAVAGLNVLSDVTGGGLVKRVEGARKSVVYEMNAAVAKQLLKALRPG